MAITLRTRGDFRSEQARFTAKVTLVGIADPTQRSDFALVVNEDSKDLTVSDLQGYAAVISNRNSTPQPANELSCPIVVVPSTSHLAPGHIVSIEPKSGTVLTVFRPESRHNVIFTTERCNSNCLMCSQPPKDHNDSWRIREHLRVLSLIDEPPHFLCITGGEPTLLGDGLIQILEEIRDRLPGTSVQMLTNG